MNTSKILANTVERERLPYLKAFTRYDAEKSRRRPIAVFDMETADGTLLGPIAGIAFTSENDFPIVKRFGGNDCMIEFLNTFLRKQYRSFVCYAHKGMGFDISHLLASEDIQKWLLANGYTTRVDRSFVIFRKKKHAWYLADSLRIVPEKLEAVLKAFAPHYTKAPLPTVPFNWEHPGWKARIENDTLGLYESVKRVEELVVNTFHIPLSLTMPATALKAARTMLPIPKVPRPARVALDWLRASYSGGRIEIFYQGEIHGHVYCFDINSAYAWSMKGEFPIGHGYYTKREPKGFFIARCNVTVNEAESIPPVLSRLFQHSFCVGEFEAFLTKDEVEFARECGATVTYIEGWAWRTTLPIFRAFIEQCEKLRKADYQGPLGKTVKLMQNGLYGILGMNSFHKTQMLSLDPPPLPWLDAFDTSNGKYAPNVYEAMIFKESPNQMPHWAAIITARVRVHLSRYLRTFEQAGLQPLYAHTDSIWCASPNGLPDAIQELVNPDEYGKLKLEKRGTRAIIVAPGEAALQLDNGEWHLAAKGWKADPKIFEHGIETTIEQTQVFRAGTALKRKSAGRIIKKVVLNYNHMKNRLPPISRPGLTRAKLALPFDYSYWNFRSWYTGKLVKENPSKRRSLLHQQEDFAMMMEKEQANPSQGGKTHGNGNGQPKESGETLASATRSREEQPAIEAPESWRQAGQQDHPGTGEHGQARTLEADGGADGSDVRRNSESIHRRAQPMEGSGPGGGTGRVQNPR